MFAPNVETEKRLQREAFLRIEISRKVLDHYKGSDLPEMKYLANTLQREFGLDPETHEELSTLFRQNCEFLGIGSGFTTSPVSKPQAGDLALPRPTTVTLAESTSSVVAFVIMPFVERQKENHLRTANRQGSDVIQSTIINDLLSGDLVIADLTEHNPNVLFELGVRMAHELPVALIKASGTGHIHVCRIAPSTRVAQARDTPSCLARPARESPGSFASVSAYSVARSDRRTRRHGPHCDFCARSKVRATRQVR